MPSKLPWDREVDPLFDPSKPSDRDAMRWALLLMVPGLIALAIALMLTSWASG